MKDVKVGDRVRVVRSDLANNKRYLDRVGYVVLEAPWERPDLVNRWHVRFERKNGRLEPELASPSCYVAFSELDLELSTTKPYQYAVTTSRPYPNHLEVNVLAAEQVAAWSVQQALEVAFAAGNRVGLPPILTLAEFGQLVVSVVRVA